MIKNYWYFHFVWDWPVNAEEEALEIVKEAL